MVSSNPAERGKETKKEEAVEVETSENVEDVKTDEAETAVEDETKTDNDNTSEDTFFNQDLTRLHSF